MFQLDPIPAIPRTRELIRLQEQAEKQQYQQTVLNRPPKEVQALGLAVLNLKLKSSKAGLYGRTLHSFTHFNYNETKKLPLLPPCKLSPGDLAMLKHADRMVMLGTIFERKKHKLTLAVDQDQTELAENCPYALYQGYNDVTYRRYHALLKDLVEKQDHVGQLLRSQERSITVGKWFDQGLNPSQKEAVVRSLSFGRISVIHGPPGTGKTSTLCELIKQACSLRMKVLVCAPSNIAVDNLAERLSKLRLVRLGNPARMLECVQESSLDSQLLNGELAKQIRSMRQEYSKLLKKLRKEDGKDQKRRIRGEIKQAKADLRENQCLNEKEIIGDAQIVLATNVGAGDSILRHYEFDLVVVDQAGQGLQVSTWIPLLKGRKAVLAGDHQQLPPTIKSKSKELETTLFDKLIKSTDIANSFLSVQYRMNSAIMGWSNSRFYGGKLVAAEKVGEWRVEGVQVLNYVDTEGWGMLEQVDSCTQTKSNPGEAELVAAIIRSLIQLDVPQRSITVLTPYNGQLTILSSTLEERYPEVEVSTVDGIQGRQNDVIVMSLVRANPKREVGFLSDYRRLNVAVTRAKKALFVVGHRPTVTCDPHIQSLFKYLQEHGNPLEVPELLEGEALQKYRNNTGLNQIWVKDREEQVKEKRQKEGQGGRKKKERKEQPPKHQPDQQQQARSEKLDELAKKAQLEYSREAHEQSVKREQQHLKFTQVIQAFMKGQQAVKVFAELSGDQRKMLHEICQEKGLSHITKARKKGKQLVVSKLTELQQKEKQQQLIRQKEAKPRKQKRKQQKVKEQQAQQVAEDEPAIQLDPSRCGLVVKSVQCKNKVHVVSYDCKFCGKSYCGKHMLAQDHGCGLVCRMQAREQFQEQMRPKHEQARAKLAAKLQKQKNSRRRKQKEKKN